MVCLADKTMGDEMDCSKCGANMEIIDGIYRCSNIPVCGIISPFQPVPFNEQKKYSMLLEKSKELIAGNMSLNEFKVLIENEFL